MYKSNQKMDQSLVNIGSNPNRCVRAHSNLEFKQFNDTNEKLLIQLLDEKRNVQFVQTHEDLFQLQEEGLALVPRDIFIDLLKSYQFNNEQLLRQGEELKQKEKVRLLRKFQSGVNFRSLQH